MGFEHGTSIWSSPEWLARATAWVDERLSAAGLARTGEVEQPSLRPWATVLRVPSSDGQVWMKATAPAVAFEVGLYELLQRVVPERVLAPLAADSERGWLLLPDGGPSLGERLRGPALVDAMAAALPAYAKLQRAVAAQTPALSALGVSDMRPAIMPSRFDEALDAVRGYTERVAAAPDADGLERVAGMRPAVVAWCEQLAESAVPPSIDHNDLHAWNVLGAGEDVRFYDWGDAVIAHPFVSMLSLGWLRVDERDLIRLRDGYLDAFSDLAPHSELVEALELACRVGKIARALTWHRAISAAEADEVDEKWLTGPAESLLSLLEDSWLGRA